MTVMCELLTQLETVSKRFRITTDQAAELRARENVVPDPLGDELGEEVTVTWQRATDRVPTVLITVPAGADRWAVPVPHRPDWLLTLIGANAPEWWLK